MVKHGSGWTVDFLEGIGSIPQDEWNALAGRDHPFTRHEFLLALEETGAVTAKTGWQPHHLLLHRDGALQAAMPLYRKHHSWGEYVFDWAWAEAAERNGIRWHPKLLAAIPYTPATGPRLLLGSGVDAASATQAAAAALCRRAEQGELSSVHLLFPEPTPSALFADAGFSVRHGAQYHWFNRGYANFDEFLATFSSRKRKAVRRERERVAEQGITFRLCDGHTATRDDWETFHRFYQLTYARHSGHGGYLPATFFQRVAQVLPDHLLLIVAEQAGEPVAGALCFRDSTTLYGRYWGSLRDVDQLHFETCYYQGIDFCIREGLTRFDPGAQGEHKIQRGFTPVLTRSCHWIREPRLRAAIDGFLEREREGIAAYIEDASQALPFRRDGT